MVFVPGTSRKCFAKSPFPKKEKGFCRKTALNLYAPGLAGQIPAGGTKYEQGGTFLSAPPVLFLLILVLLRLNIHGVRIRVTAHSGQLRSRPQAIE
jgi:hypothetical protein